MSRKSSSKLTPLKDAPWVFASPGQRSELRRVQEATNQTKGSESYSGRAQSLADNPAEAVKMLAEGVQGLVESMMTRGAPVWAMRESLVRKLEEGKLEACGVQSAPKQKRHLEVLPEHFFVDAKISWNGNNVTNFGVTYSAVRVRRRSSATPIALTEKVLKAPAADTPRVSDTTSSTERDSDDIQRQKPGPVSGAEEVISAYNELLRNGVLNESMTVKTIHKKLYPILKQNKSVFPNERGLAYSSIARHLLRHRRVSLKLSS
jgi:hypothetical protein